MLNSLEQETLQDSNREVSIEKTKEYLLRAMGRKNYILCKDFFESVWNSGTAYKVFMAPRCMNLMYLFFQCSGRDRDDALANSFFSDEALLSNAREIVDFYKEAGFLPRILLADVILLHGRAINEFIARLIAKISSCLLDDGLVS